MKSIRTILALLALCAAAAAQDAYDFVDKATGTTNGPVVVRPCAGVRIGGREYEVRRSTVPLPCETNVVPSVHLVVATLGAALAEVLPASGIPTNDLARVVVFRESIVTNRITLATRAIRVGELLPLLCSICDVTLLRDYESEAIVLMPNALADGRGARVLGVIPETYDQMIKPYGSFNRLLVETGVIKRENHALCDFQRDRSLLVLYGSPEVFHQFECVFTVLRIKREDGQQTVRGDFGTRADDGAGSSSPQP